MTIRRITALAVLLACASAVLLSAASAGSKATKQCVSFLVNFNPETETASWQLIPLSRGPLKRDSGSSTGTGTIGALSRLNGQRVTPIAGSDTMTGKLGTFVVSQKIVSTDVGDRYSADIGTWKFVRGTGAYKSVTGGGRFAGVGLPSGNTVLINEEGCLRIG